MRNSEDQGKLRSWGVVEHQVLQVELSLCLEERACKCDLSWTLYLKTLDTKLRFDIPRNLSGPLSIRNSAAYQGRADPGEIRVLDYRSDRNASGRIQATSDTCLLPDSD